MIGDNIRQPGETMLSEVSKKQSKLCDFIEERAKITKLFEADNRKEISRAGGRKPWENVAIKHKASVIQMRGL